MSRFPPIEDLVPHAPPMLAVERLVEWSPGRAETELTVRDGGPFVRDGVVGAACTLEYMAQSVAACLGYEAFRGGVGVRVGMVVACRAMTIERDTLPVGTTLRITVTRVRGTDDASQFEAETRSDGELVARATLTLVHAEVPPEAGGMEPGT